MASVDAQQYAEALRKSLMEDLFNGEDLVDTGDTVELRDTPAADSTQQFMDLDQELEEFASHEVIRNILDQGVVLKEYTRDVDDKLRALELESIQDYIQESDNLVALHEQVDPR